MHFIRYIFAVLHCCTVASSDVLQLHLHLYSRGIKTTETFTYDLGDEHSKSPFMKTVLWWRGCTELRMIRLLTF